MKNLHLPPGDASLLAQLLLARGDPDALGAGGETVPWGPQRGNGGTGERWWMSCPSFYLAGPGKNCFSWDLNGIIVIV